MQLITEAVIVAVRAHGEHGAIVRALTPGEGVQAGYVRGGKSRRLRPVLVPGNRVQAEFRARTEEQLPHLAVELAHSRAFLLSEPLAAAGIEWACTLAAAALPEGQPYPRLYEGLEGLLGAIEAAPSARGWAAALVGYERLVLGEAGFGLDRPAAPLRADEEWTAIREGLGRTGRLLERDLLTGRRGEVLAARERLVDRLGRIPG
jgi:DNA repair protein RecO (recombination protein O)